MRSLSGSAATDATAGGRGTAGGEGLPHATMVFWVLVISTSVLLGLGLLMVLSASVVYSLREDGSAFALAARQTTFAVVGAACAYVAVRMRPRFWRASSPLVLVLSVVLLVLVLFLGVEVGGQRNWLEIWGPVRLQPSELAKLALVLWVPLVLATRVGARNGHRLDRGADPHAPGAQEGWVRTLLPVGLGSGLLIGLVLLEKDLGTPMVMVPIVLAMMWAAGAPKRIFAVVVVLGAMSVGGLSVLQPYRLERFQSWLDPWADPLGSGMQAVHGQLALGSGGLLGQGLGASKEKWGSLPAAHTDFILGVIGEELGLLGSLAVLAAITAVVWAALQIAVHTTDSYVRYASVGIAAWIGVQSIVNVGAVIGALPITGVTLPLVSYGGSSLVPTMVALAVLMSFVRPPSIRPWGLR